MEIKMPERIVQTVYLARSARISAMGAKLHCPYYWCIVGTQTTKVKRNFHKFLKLTLALVKSDRAAFGYFAWPGRRIRPGSLFPWKLSGKRTLHHKLLIARTSGNRSARRGLPDNHLKPSLLVPAGWLTASGAGVAAALDFSLTFFSSDAIGGSVLGELVKLPIASSTLRAAILSSWAGNMAVDCASVGGGPASNVGRRGTPPPASIAGLALARTVLL